MRYYGCKTKLLDHIENIVMSLNLKADSVFFDLFSGTSQVGKHFKNLGFTVYANDFLEFAHAIAYAYIKINKEPKFNKLKSVISIEDSEDVVNYLNQIKPKAGFITKNYSPYNGNNRMYLSVNNAKRVDVIRSQIHEWRKVELISQEEYYYLITSLIEAINLTSNVTGTYAAFLKKWDNRALKNIVLKKPNIIKSKRINKVFKEDANSLVNKQKVDVLYLDPPYNSRQFASNYFLLELIAEGWFEKKPQIYGYSGMRPYKHQKSKYSIKKEAKKTLEELTEKARAKYIIMSYNDEGIIPLNEIKEILGRKGNVQIFKKEHKRYRAINQNGEKTKTKENLFLVKTI